ncbi:hypothetical protein H7198_03495 [Fructobacillus sp. CRL 2054]|uniref:hypothetical protein n=1 Tax=Fructobacillus sp. CRL 2054 TaxID=2763007 RepID=UPI002379BED9|nr:hypothetical protein [Fructobacillus sp. CRL 2054]MDD9138665.1 hypothetical protein [Fructobacillus sp. CRL 2054]
MTIHETDVVRLKDGRTPNVASIQTDGTYVFEFVSEDNMSTFEKGNLDEVVAVIFKA